MTFAGVLLAVCIAAEGCALVLAVVHTKNGADYSKVLHERGIAGGFSRLVTALRTGYRSPLVRLLAFALAADVSIAALTPLAGRAPFVGLARVSYHAVHALVMAWPLGVAWACRATFAPVREPSVSRAGEGTADALTQRSRMLPALVPGAWIGCTASLILAHPLSRPFTARTLHAFELLCVAVTWLAIRRGWRARWGVEHRALVVLAFFETVVATVGPFAGDVFASWPVVGCGLYLAAFASVAGVLGWELRGRRLADCSDDRIESQ